MGDEYKPFIQMVNEAKEDVKKQAFKKKEEGFDPLKGLSDEQIKFAENTIELLNNPAFRYYKEYEAVLTANCLRSAFHVRYDRDENGNILPSGKRYGEVMSYNEGNYHGMLVMPSERDRLWALYLKSKQQKNKGEGV